MAKKPTNGKPNGIEQLFEAVKRGDTKAVEELLAQGVPVDCRDKEERTPLMEAADRGHVEILKLLLDRGANTNAVDVDGETATIAATYADQLEVVQILHSHGAVLDNPNNQGRTALDIAKDGGADALASYLAAHSSGSPELTGEEPDKVLSAEVEVIEVEESGELAAGGDVESRVDAVTLGQPTVAASAQQAAGTSDSSFYDEVVSEELAKVSPHYFQSLMSVDQVTKLYLDSVSQTDEVQRSTSKTISVQCSLQPDLPNKLKEREDLTPHAGTIRNWRLAGDACLKLEGAGIDTGPFGVSQLLEFSKAPSDEIMVNTAKETAAKKLSVREIRKIMSPSIKRAKLEASGELEEMGPQCVEIIEGLDHPGKLMMQRETLLLLQDSERLKAEFTKEERFRIHEKANSAETKIVKQRRALEEKSAAFMQVVNFLRMIRKSISATFESGQD